MIDTVCDMLLVAYVLLYGRYCLQHGSEKICETSKLDKIIEKV